MINKVLQKSETLLLKLGAEIHMRCLYIIYWEHCSNPTEDDKYMLKIFASFALQATFVGNQNKDKMDRNVISTETWDSHMRS